MTEVQIQGFGNVDNSFHPDTVGFKNMDRIDALDAARRVFTEKDSVEFYTLFGIDGEEKEALKGIFDRFGEKVVEIHKKEEFTDEEVDMAKEQDLGYRTGVVLRMFSEKLSDFPNIWEGVAGVLRKYQGIEAANELNRMFGMSFGKTAEEVQSKIDNYELYFLGHLNTSKPDMVRINLVAGEVVTASNLYAKKLGKSPKEFQEIFGRFTELEGDDTYIKMLLERKGGSLEKQKMADFIGRLAHLGWMLNQVGRQRYEKDFTNKGYMYGTYRQMIEQSIQSEDAASVWSNMAKDFDQYRTVIGFMDRKHDPQNFARDFGLK